MKADLLPNDLLPNEASSMTRALNSERWSKAEQKTAELVASIQPNQKALSRCQVYTFGSVPLKTYLPDGDIDLTIMSENETLKNTWAIKVRDMQKNEEKNKKAEFRVKEVQDIPAKVMIVKCLVENIVVDISFNQIGGLCTLCFLEEIDHLINQNHLFKRSIILIKAWCYNESHILGARHGLFLPTLWRPWFFTCFMSITVRWLDHLSLWGPVPTGLLPDMTAEPPWKDSGELLITNKQQPWM